MSSPKYKRVVLKLSGEALAGDKGFGINPDVIKSIAIQIKELAELDVEVAVVVEEEIFGGVKPVKKWEWTGQPPITWACSPRS